MNLLLLFDIQYAVHYLFMAAKCVGKYILRLYRCATGRTSDVRFTGRRFEFWLGTSA